MAKEVSEVRDIPAEIWIKALAGLASITMLLTAFIGIRVIDRLDQIGGTLVEVVSLVQVHKSEISTLKAADKEMNIKVDGINKRVYQLEGKQNGKEETL
jgi:hypothetical protein